LSPSSERTPEAAPVSPRARITNLDTVRGVAVLGILTMNVVSFGLVATAPYFNLSAGGSETWLDWLIGGGGEILADQKFMGLFSMLFGAGIVLFADRAEAKGRRPALFSLWRNFLLLLIGIAHTLIWDGDILVIYALCAPILIALRRLGPAPLLALGTATVLLSPLLALAAADTVGPGGAGLGEYWFAGGPVSDEVGLYLYADFFCRALGMMLIGVALYRTGVITGARPAAFYRRLAAWGLGVGIPLAALGLALVAGSGYSPDLALVGGIPNTIGTIPAALGYLGLISLWNLRPPGRLHQRVRAVGRMALTNYLAQTALGFALLRGVLDPADLTRTGLAAFVIAAWALQLWWSEWWLSRFRYGPAEWLWRSGTYRHLQPIRLPSEPAPPTDAGADTGGV
jgi:uncharacterized protein